MGNVPEGYREAVVEAFVKSATFHSDSIKRSKAFPNSALSAAVESFVAVNSDGRNDPLGMVISAQKKSASRSRPRRITLLPLPRR